MKKLIAVTLLACAGIIIAFAISGISRTDTPAVTEVAKLHTSSAASGEESIQRYKNELNRLLSLGLSRDEAGSVLLTRLRIDFGDSGARQAYWTSSWGARSRNLSGAADASRQIRKILMEVFGSDAEDLPSLRQSLRPLDPDYDFLTADQQFALMAYNTRISADLHRAAPQDSALDRVSQYVMAAPVTSPSLDEWGVGLDLPEGMKKEVALRDSPLAAIIRSTGATLTEAEFRAAFDALQKTSLRAHALMGLLRQGKLGEENLSLLLARFDPAWSRLQRFGQESGLAQHLLLKAYGHHTEAMETAARLVSGAAGVSQDASGLRLAFEERDRQIRSAIGGSLGEQLLEHLRLPTSGSNAPGAPRASGYGTTFRPL